MNEGWQELRAPPQANVVLPSWMNDRYRLWMPCHDESGRALNWEFQKWQQGGAPTGQMGGPPINQRRIATDISPATRRQNRYGLFQEGYDPTPLTQFNHRDPLSRCCRHAPPPPPFDDPCCPYCVALHYRSPMLDGGRARPWSNEPPVVSEELPKDISRRRSDKFKIFVAEGGGDEHLVINVGDILMEVRPRESPHIYECNRDDWEKKACHRDVIDVGDQESALRGCLVSYSVSRPRTHVYVHGLAMHFHNLVRITFTHQKGASSVAP